MEVLTHACHDGVGGSGTMKEMNSAIRNISQSTRITRDSDIHSRNFANDILLGCLVGITLWLILAVLIMTYWFGTKESKIVHLVGLECVSPFARYLEMEVQRSAARTNFVKYSVRMFGSRRCNIDAYCRRSIPLNVAVFSASISSPSLRIRLARKSLADPLYRLGPSWSQLYRKDQSQCIHSTKM